MRWPDWTTSTQSVYVRSVCSWAATTDARRRAHRGRRSARLSDYGRGAGARLFKINHYGISSLSAIRSIREWRGLKNKIEPHRGVCLRTSDTQVRGAGPRQEPPTNRPASP